MCEAQEFSLCLFRQSFQLCELEIPLHIFMKKKSLREIMKNFHNPIDPLTKGAKKFLCEKLII